MNDSITRPVDPRPFMNHMADAVKWAQWNGKKGTERQALKIMNQIDAATLRRMLAERGL